MLPPVTDQLEERRKRREARARAAHTNGGGGRGQTPQAARDLLGGLITGAEDANQPQRHERQPEPGTPDVSTNTRAREPDEATDGESVQDLVRRVQESTAARIGQDPAATRRRALSTVDLPPAANRQRRTGPLLDRLAIKRASATGALQRTAHKRVAAVAVVSAALAILVAVAVTALAARGAARRPHTPAPNAHLAAEASHPLRDALTPTIGDISTDLHALAQVVRTMPTVSHREHKPTPRPVSHHRQSLTQAHIVAAGDSNAKSGSSAAGGAGGGTRVQSSPAVGAAPETQTPSTAVNATSHTTAGSHTPATHHSQPAGPTGSNPMGGLGSCVSGCT